MCVSAYIRVARFRTGKAEKNDMEKDVFMDYEDKQ